MEDTLQHPRDTELVQHPLHLPQVLQVQDARGRGPSRPHQQGQGTCRIKILGVSVLDFFFHYCKFVCFMHLIYIDQNTPIAPHTNNYTFNLLLHVGGICSIRELFLRYSSKL